MKFSRNSFFVSLLFLAVLSFLPIFSVATAQEITATIEPTQPVVAATVAATDTAGLPVWSYRGETGPAHWSQLSSYFVLCKSGKAQSPINIITPIAPSLSAIQFNYKSSALTTQNDGQTILMNYDPGSTITLDGTAYTLQQLDFHHPAEHKINGIIYPMEMHLVHVDASGNLAIIAVMIQESNQDNPVLAPIVDNISANQDEVTTIANVTINANDMLPAQRDYYSYAGSLTTPPCTEGVRWLVLATPITLSPAQLTKFVQATPRDARPLQRLNSSPVLAGGGS